MKKVMIKPPAEIFYEKELKALALNDKSEKPESWLLSPKAVRTFILGSNKPVKYKKEEIKIKQKFFGDDILVEQCIVTLAGNRGLMLIGDPGTAKTMLSELLASAVCGISTNTVQGTAGTAEDMIKYSWNYALLLDKGPVPEALVPAPLYVGMNKGIITRFEEITRCPQEVQDSLISVMSDKVLNIPELGEEGVIFAKPGFNIIATANTKDRGVNDMSSALKRRLNFQTVKPISNLQLETTIIEQETLKLLKQSGIEVPIERDVLNILTTTFHELRNGVSIEGHKIDKPDAIMSTAEAVSVYYQSAMNAFYYNEDKINMDKLVQNMLGTVLKDNKDDIHKLKNYFSVIVKRRSEKDKLWSDFYTGKKWIK
jgi:MoxR-like ATPase